MSLNLKSNTGFFDEKTLSAANIYGQIFQIIHGNNRYGEDTGYTCIFFLPTFDQENSGFPHIALSLSKLTINVPFKLELNLWTNLAKDPAQSAKFYVAYQTSGMADRAFFAKPFEVKEGNRLNIDVTVPTANGEYYFWVWGVYPNTALWIEYNAINVCY